jgi:DNA-binding beta-propeller fold protein YncE
MAKSPDDRFASGAELVEAASAALGLQQPPVRERRTLLLIVAGLGIAAAAILAGVLLSRQGSESGAPSTRPTLTPAVDSLQRLDPKTNKLVATMPTGRFPTAVAVGAGSIWAGALDDQRITRIDPATNRVTGTITTGGPESIAVGDRDV